MSSILRKFKQKEDRENIDKTRFMMRNGETVLKELIASSNGELLSGQLGFHLARGDYSDVMKVDHMKKCFEEKRFIEVVDPRIVEDNSCPGKEQLLQASALLMFECVNASPIERPTMADVAKRLRQLYR